MAAVIMQQPNNQIRKTAWSSGICDCCQDLNSCCYGYWCFPCFMCTTTAEFGESTCLPLLDICGPSLMTFFGISSCVPPVTLGMRVAVRYKYNIGGSICEDIMVSYFCMWCSWCQMSREIKARKQDVKIIQTVPVFHPMPMPAQTRVVPKQQMVNVAPAAQVIQMQPVRIG